MSAKEQPDKKKKSGDEGEKDPQASSAEARHSASIALGLLPSAHGASARCQSEAPHPGLLEPPKEKAPFGALSSEL